jgi:hypothetical protein
MQEEADARYQLWVERFERISNETYTLFLYRDYWRGLAEMTEANDEIPPSTFFHALGVWYAATQGTNVRRQLDRDPRAVSFRNLLTEIRDYPEVMTRERHVAIWDVGEGPGAAYTLRLADQNFDRFAGPGNDLIDPARTEADINRLWTVGSPIARYVNETVAHTQEIPTVSAPTYADLHAAIEEIGELLKKYSSLLNAAILPILSPVHQADWQAAFRVAWLR